jgi:hypothetical protein
MIDSDIYSNTIKNALDAYKGNNHISLFVVSSYVLTQGPTSKMAYILLSKFFVHFCRVLIIYGASFPCATRTHFALSLRGTTIVITLSSVLVFLCSCVLVF